MMGATAVVDTRFALAEDLERHLGDPRSEATLFSYARCVASDARSEFPAEICRDLDGWGLPAYYIPTAFGGRLGGSQVVDGNDGGSHDGSSQDGSSQDSGSQDSGGRDGSRQARSMEQVLNAMRAVARRDLTVAIAHGKTFLGSICVWIAGSPPLAEALAEQVLAGKAVSWGLTERDHGSDLLAGEVSARPAVGGFEVSGEKWLVNNATRGQFVSLLARTAPGGGPRGFDVFLVDKATLAPGSFHHLPKVRTEGICGADISGIAFHGAFVPADARLGASGTGLETVLRGLQLTRTMCAVLSLGAGDHALRLVFDFADGRRLYGRRLADLPQARRVLVDAYADQLLAEALTTVAARSVHALAGELSLTSAVVKYLVPTRTEAAIAALGRLFGARSFLVDGIGVCTGDGSFAKLARDNRIVGLFDGSTLVNLNVIVNHFPVLSRAAQHGRVADTAGVDVVFDTSRELPPLDLSGLSLLARHGSSVVAALPGHAARLGKLAEDDRRLQPVAVLAGRLADNLSRLLAEMSEQPLARVKVPASSFDLAARFALCVAGAAAVGLWVGSRQARPEAHVQELLEGQRLRDHGFSARPEAHVQELLWVDGIWLRAALARVLSALGEPVEPDPEVDAAAFAALGCQARNGRMFSLWPCRLAEAGS